ncbi:hypothetical protein Tco_1019451 [Tanacetum coccineum]|uniref:Transposase (Putative), gypsy type n=1 Tax=Tanacetum coccineum TaxID=301880 RepID=A0ABQ5FX71_9ASTR
MGRDTIQLETTVSTISQEYLLEFTSEYGISEDLHLELPGPEERIVDFPEGKVDERVFPTVVDWRISASKDGMPVEGSYSVEDVATLDTHHMDLFNLISAPNPTIVKTETRPRTTHEVSLLTITASRVIEMEDPVTTSTSSETPSIMEKSPLDISSEDLPPMITNKGETEDQAPTVVSQEVPSAENIATAEVAPELNLDKEGTTMRPPVNKRFRKRDQSTVEANAPPKVLRKDHASVHPAQDTRGGKSLAAMGLGPGGSHSTAREAKLLKKFVAQVARQNQRTQARENELKNLEALLEAEADMKKAVEAKNAEIAQVTGEERIKVAFEEFKKYEDDKVEQRCTEIDTRLDKLSVDFDEELYPHMLTTIAGRRWIRRTFADVVSAGLAKGMSERLRYGIEHGKAGRNLVDVEAYDPEANRKLVKALQDLKNLKYLMVDELERLKDAQVELIMASLHLESDTGEDTPQWIRDLPNKSRVKKKKKCRVVCRTHGIGSAHHPRSDGIPVSAPTVVP